MYFKCIRWLKLERALLFYRWIYSGNADFVGLILGCYERQSYDSKVQTAAMIPNQTADLLACSLKSVTQPYSSSTYRLLLVWWICITSSKARERNYFPKRYSQFDNLVCPPWDTGFLFDQPYILVWHLSMFEGTVRRSAFVSALLACMIHRQASLRDHILDKKKIQQ